MTLYTVRDIAGKLGISVSAVHQRILRCRAQRAIGQKHGGVWLFTPAEVTRIQEVSK